MLEAMQSIYGNVTVPLAELERLGASRFGMTPEQVLAALETGREGQGRLLTKRGNGARWAVFLRPGW